MKVAVVWRKDEIRASKIFAEESEAIQWQDYLKAKGIDSVIEPYRG